MEIDDFFGPKRSTGPNVNFLVPKGRDPGRDPSVLWWDLGPLSSQRLTGAKNWHEISDLTPKR